MIGFNIIVCSFDDTGLWLDLRADQVAETISKNFVFRDQHEGADQLPLASIFGVIFLLFCLSGSFQLNHAISGLD